MTWRDAWKVARPLLWEGLRLYAPQVKIPADILKLVGKKLHKLLKGKKKLVNRIRKVDDLIEELSAKLDTLTNEREDLVLQYADVVELVDKINNYQKRSSR